MIGAPSLSVFPSLFAMSKPALESPLVHDLFRGPCLSPECCTLTFTSACSRKGGNFVALILSFFSFFHFFPPFLLDELWTDGGRRLPCVVRVEAFPVSLPCSPAPRSRCIGNVVRRPRQARAQLGKRLPAIYWAAQDTWSFQSTKGP